MQSHPRKLAVKLALVICLLATLSACGFPLPSLSIPVGSVGPQQFDGQKAYEFAAAQVGFGFRPTGSDASHKTADYIAASLKESGWTVTMQPFDLTINGETYHSQNVIGTLGKGPVVVIGAHFDTRLWANNDPDQARRFDPVMGANDAASGVAVMLELARVFGQSYTLNREIRLVFLDAEDNGNIPGWGDFSLGATYYADHLDVTPEYVIILDMIGDKDLNVYYEGQSMKSDPALMTDIFQTAASLGYADNFIAKLKFTMMDDHAPFIQKGIKAIDLIDFDYPYWHTISDTLDKISAESMEKIGRTLQKYFEQTGVITPS